MELHLLGRAYPTWKNSGPGTNTQVFFWHVGKKGLLLHLFPRKLDPTQKKKERKKKS
jgi:hypothetical protein